MCVVCGEKVCNVAQFQVLPCVAEVFRWYNMAALTSLCERHLTGQKTSVMEYGMMLTVKYSMQHAANLTQFCRQSQVLCQVTLASLLGFLCSQGSPPEFYQQESVGLL